MSVPPLLFDAAAALALPATLGGEAADARSGRSFASAPALGAVGCAHGGCCACGSVLQPPLAPLAGGGPVVDVHTHILPASWPSLRARYGVGGWVQTEPLAAAPCGAARARLFRDDGTPFRDVDERCWSLARRLADADARGVDVQVLSTVPALFAYDKPAEAALDLSMMLNDHIARCAAAAPTRFVGLGTLPLQAPALAVAELRRCAGLGLRGVQIGSRVNSWTLAEPALAPLWAAAEEAGMAVFVHPWGEPMMGGDLLTRYWLPWLVAMPAETSQAVCSLLFSGVLERHPALRVCFAHGGGAYAATAGRVQQGYDVRPDLCATHCAVPPRAQHGRFWVDALVHDDDVLRLAAKIFGENRICMGTDYPFPLGEFTPESRGRDWAAGALIDAAGLPPDARARMLGGNALEWLGMTVQDFERGR